MLTAWKPCGLSRGSPEGAWMDSDRALARRKRKTGVGSPGLKPRAGGMEALRAKTGKHRRCLDGIRQGFSPTVGDYGTVESQGFSPTEEENGG